MKTTPLAEQHRKLGAKMVDFAGYEMPLVYSNLKEEHRAVREAAGMFDVSHMGEFIIKGKGSTELVQYVTSNDVRRIKPGQAQYSCFPRPQGGIVDDLLVYRLTPNPAMQANEEDAYMLVVNASNIDKDLEWIKSHNSFGAEIHDISDETALLAVQGPRAVEVLNELTDIDLEHIPYYHFRRGTLAGVDNVIISATGYTGSGGFELYVAAKDAAKLWDAILAAGKPYGLLPCGLGARDTLRLEKGYCLYGNDIDDETTPLEAGLGWITKLEGDDFVGKDHLKKQKEEGIPRRLVAFRVEDRRAPRNGYEIKNQGGEVIGRVTSGTHAPTLDFPLGMGYVKSGFHKVGTPIKIDLGRKQVDATVIKL